MQTCSWFYLHRRHDIPCPLKPDTERCSPHSCCRCSSVANTGVAIRTAERNPIGLTCTIPNLSKKTQPKDSAGGSTRERRGRYRRKDGGVEHIMNGQSKMAKWVVTSKTYSILYSLFEIFCFYLCF